MQQRTNLTEKLGSTQQIKKMQILNHNFEDDDETELRPPPNTRSSFEKKQAYLHIKKNDVLSGVEYDLPSAPALLEDESQQILDDGNNGAEDIPEVGQLLSSPELESFENNFDNVSISHPISERHTGMSHVSHVQSSVYSDPFKLNNLSIFIIFIIVIGIFIGYPFNWHLGICFNILYLGTLPFWYWWYESRYHAPIHFPLTSFGMGFVVCIFTVLVQLFISIIVVLTFTVIGLEGNFLIIMCIVFLAVSCVTVEEWAKFYVFIRNKGENTNLNETRKDLINATFIALGFALAQAFIWIDVIELNEVRSPVSVKILLTICFAIWGTPLHILCAYLTGLLVNLGTSSRTIVAYNVWYRSVYVLEMLLMLIYDQTIIFICCVVFIIAIYCCLIRHIKLTEQLMPVEYLNRVGYLSAFGYGVLDNEALSGNNEEENQF